MPPPRGRQGDLKLVTVDHDPSRSPQRTEVHSDPAFVEASGGGVVAGVHRNDQALVFVFAGEHVEVPVVRRMQRPV